MMKLVLRLLQFIVVQAAAAASSTSIVSPLPFLSQLTRQDLQDALETANSLHATAVQNALDHYPIDTSLAPDHEIVDRMEFDEYSIQAPGSLPDFVDQLQRQVFVTRTPLFTAEECQQVIADANAHFMMNDGEWTRLPSGSHLVAGFWIKDVPAVYEWFLKAVRKRLFPLLARQFPHFVNSPNDLCVDNAYLFKYTPETGRRTDIHTDSGCLSFTIALNSGNGVHYKGGGTWFEGLKRGDGTDLPESIIEMNQGHVTIRPGGVKHCGHAVESGERYIIGGFCMHQQKPEPVRQLCASGTVPNLEAAVALNPQFDPSYNLLAHAYEQVDPKSPNREKRKIVLEYCLKNVHPYSGGVAYALGSIYHQQGDFQKAKVCFEKCLQADAMDVEAMAGLMVISAELGLIEDEKMYARQIVATPTASSVALCQAYCNLGVLHADSPQEVHFYKTALKYEPTRFAPRYSLACAYAARHEYSKAVAEFQRALESSEASPEDTTKVLKQLYKAAAHQIQQEYKGKSPSRDEIMHRFAQVMGPENLQKVKAMSASSSNTQQEAVTGNAACS